MSDDALQYFQAWSSVMVDHESVAPAKLLCSWHVCRTFERNLLSCDKELEDREELFAYLKLIMAELDKEKCLSFLSLFQNMLKTTKRKVEVKKKDAKTTNQEN